jgi:hypothetical protein
MAHSYSYSFFQTLQTRTASVEVTSGPGPVSSAPFVTNSTSFATTITSNVSAATITSNTLSITAVSPGSFGLNYVGGETINAGGAMSNSSVNNQVVFSNYIVKLGHSLERPFAPRVVTATPLTWPIEINPQAMADYAELTETLTELYNLEEGRGGLDGKKHTETKHLYSWAEIGCV